MRLQTAASAAIIVGALAFALFWESSVFWDDELLGASAPWMVRLGIHGVSIVLIIFALVTRYWFGTGPGGGDKLFPRLAVTVAIAGLITVLPVFFVGMVLLGLVAAIARRDPISSIPLLAGGVLFLINYATGVRLGFEDGPPLTGADKTVAAVAIGMTAAGMCALPFAWRSRTAATTP